MLLNEIYKILNAEIPEQLSNDYIAAYGGHDNSGILLDTGNPIEKVMFSLDLFTSAIRCAANENASLIVTHHPAIFYPISDLRVDDALGNNILLCAQKGVSVISMHLNADCAAHGVDYYLARAAGASEAENQPLQPVSGGGYGRVFSVAEQSLSDFASSLQKTLGAQRVWTFGKEWPITRVATFCGAGIDATSLKLARDHGAQAVISADIKYNYVCEALSYGLSVIQLTHYASENYGFRKIYQNLKDKLGVASFYCDAEEML